MIDADNKQWLIDCGPTVPRALWQRGGEVNDIDAIYFTHVHPDHCTGLTALLNHWKSYSRQKPVIIYCQPAQQPVLMQLAALANWPQADLGFTIDWQECREAWTWQDWQIRTAPTQHELSNRAIRITIAGQTLFYSGDGRPTADSIALMAGAGLAFQECASVAALDDDASHGDFPSCLMLFRTLQLPAMGLYHCEDASLSALKQACQPWPGLFVSRDGLTLTLPRPTPTDETYLL